MTFSYQLTLDEYVNAGKILLGRQKKQYLIAFLLIVVVFLLLDLKGGEKIIQSILSAVVYGVFMLVLFWLLIRFKIKQKYKKDKTYSKPVSFSVSDAGLEIEYSLGKSFLKWKAFEGFECNEALCILFTSQSCGHIIPLRLFNTEESKQLRAILTKNIT